MKLIMELLSDALPGSGEGLAGIIDADVNYDDCGLPYIPAKRLKGILREAALDLCDVGKLTETQLATLFGKRGEMRGTAFRLSDGYLPDYPQLRAFLKECSKNEQCQKEYGSVFHRQAVLDFYSYTRSQTAIEDEGESVGVAKEHSLRTFRVLKKGLTFGFECESLSKDDLEKLNLICAVTRRFGSSRTRGLGAIALHCDCSAAPTNPTSQDDHNAEQPTFQEDETCVCRLNIQTHGQLLVTNEVGNDQVSEAYLPGSFLLGALADAYMQHNHLKNENAHEDAQFRAMFLHGAVRFGHAYPVKNDQVYFPAPFSIVKEKDVNHFYDLAHAELDADIQTKGGIGEFVVLNGEEAQTCSPDREIEYHHARPEDNRGLGHAKRSDGQFFQFDVLAPQQQFRAEIIGNYAHLKEIQELIADTPTLFLGKSKTAQYGKCALTATLAKLDKTVDQIAWNNGERLVVTLASDMLLCNENGMMLPDPECFNDELFEQLKRKVPNLTKDQIVIDNKKFLKTKQIGGFLGVWNMPKIQGTALAAGSVIVLRNNSGQDIDVTALQTASFGLRTEEGFGRIKLNWHGEYHEIKKLKDHNNEQPNFAPDLTTAKTLIVHIIKQRIQAALKSEARTKMKEIHAMPTNAFLGRLRLFLTSSTIFQAFGDKCSALKPRGREHLMKLDDVLFLEERDIKRQDTKPLPANEKQKDLRPQSEKTIGVRLRKTNTDDKDGFADFIDQVAVIQNIRSWKAPILSYAKLEFEKMLQDNKQLFAWYQQYALHLITLLKFKNRNKEGGHREK